MSGVAIVLVWNPAVYAFSDLPEICDLIRRGSPAPFHWAAGRCGDARPGETIYLWRRSPLPEGIIASGKVTGEIFAGEHFADRTKRAMFLPIEFHAFIAVATGVPLDAQMLASELGPAWGSPPNGMRMPAEDESIAAEMWASHIKHSAGSVLLPEEFV